MGPLTIAFEFGDIASYMCFAAPALPAIGALLIVYAMFTPPRTSRPGAPRFPSIARWHAAVILAVGIGMLVSLFLRCSMGDGGDGAAQKASWQENILNYTFWVALMILWPLSNHVLLCLLITILSRRLEAAALALMTTLGLLGIVATNAPLYYASYTCTSNMMGPAMMVWPAIALGPMGLGMAIASLILRVRFKPTPA
jgi:hypothetical protein